MRALLLAAAACAAFGPAAAEPYLALRAGLACEACHLNRTGGGGRTAYGASFGATSLPWTRAGGRAGLADGAIGERVRIGADLRGGYLGHFRAGGPYLGEIRLSEANLYLGADLLPERLSVYVAESVAPGGAESREAFALYSTRRAGFYVKAGKFILPYGLRLQDDDAATRRGTGFTFESADLGVEAGAGGERWSATVAVSNGTSGAAEQDNRKQYTASAAFIHPLGRIGLSISDNVLPKSAHRELAGIFGGFDAGPLVVLAEIDETNARDDAGRVARGAAGHVEGDLTVHRGLTLRAWTGAYDLDRSDALERFRQWGAGIDWTALPGLQVRLSFRNRGGPGAVEGSRDAEALAEVHVYF